MLEEVAKIVGVGVAGWVVLALHQVMVELRSLRVILVGDKGDNGINSRVKGHALVLERHDDHLAKHDVQLAMLRGRE